MAEILTRILDEKLKVAFDPSREMLPSPEELKYKVLIKVWMILNSFAERGCCTIM